MCVCTLGLRYTLNELNFNVYFLLLDYGLQAQSSLFVSMIVSVCDWTQVETKKEAFARLTLWNKSLYHTAEMLRFAFKV